MSATELKRMDVNGLDIFSNPCDLRKDLHTFVEYIASHDVKRTTRDNELPKADIRRLVKLMRNPEVLMKMKDDDWIDWLMYVDETALKLGFVKYDTEGKYRGYSSVSPSFTENYIEYKEKKYNKFLSLSLPDQEQTLLETLIKDANYSENELLRTSIMGTLDTFDRAGCGTGVLPHVDFAKVRWTIFNILINCRSDVWYSVESLVRYMKTQHPFFLIPEKPRYKHDYYKEKGRYCNFHEGRRYAGELNAISPEDPDAFERVEGRYVERFLEGIPLTLGYLSVAYSSSEDQKAYPSINRLKAFKVSKTFLHFMGKKIASPKITIQPNFEVFVESELYPASVLKELSPFTEIISTDAVAVLKLQKKKVVEYLANNGSVDVISFLKEMSHMELPGNVNVELEQWAGHSEKFIVYSGFGLLEGGDGQTVADNMTIERITPSLRIVKDTQKLFSELERKELAPILVRHSNMSLKNLPDNVKTVFSYKEKKNAKPKKKKSIILKREKSITLYFPEESILKEFRKELIKVRCPFRVDRSAKTVTYLEQHKGIVVDAIKALKKDFSIKIKEMGG